MEDIVDDLLRIEQRIDSVITFALIRFVHTIGRTVLQEEELALLTGTTLVLLHFVPTKTHLASILDMMKKILVMVFSQSVINVVSQNDALLQLHNPHYSILLRAFTITTCLLVLMSLLCYAFRTVDAVQRSMTLLLYIYADANAGIWRRAQQRDTRPRRGYGEGQIWYVPPKGRRSQVQSGEGTPLTAPSAHNARHPPGAGCCSRFQILQCALAAHRSALCAQWAIRRPRLPLTEAVSGRATGIIHCPPATAMPCSIATAPFAIAVIHTSRCAPQRTAPRACSLSIACGGGAQMHKHDRRGRRGYSLCSRGPEDGPGKRKSVNFALGYA